MDKLVRDLIPKIIEKKGDRPIGYIANESEYRYRIIDKLVEEVNEFQESESIEELADILEVVDHIYDAFGFAKQQVMEIKNQKQQESGRFKIRYILQGVAIGTPREGAGP